MCELFEPLYKLLRVVDTEVYLTMGIVYKFMRIVREELEKKNDAKWVLKIINGR